MFQRFLRISCLAVLALLVSGSLVSAEVVTPEIKDSTSVQKASLIINKQKRTIVDFIHTLEQMGHISINDADNYFTQLKSLEEKFGTIKGSKGSIGEYMDLAQDLDSLACQIATGATVSNVGPNLYEINNHSQKKIILTDNSEDKIEIISVSSSELKMMFQKRKEILNSRLQSNDTEEFNLNMERELASLNQLEKVLAKPDLNEPVVLKTSIPVAIERDLSGNRILGIVKSYKLRGITDLCQLTPQINIREIVGDLNSQRKMVEEKYKAEFLKGNISKAEAKELEGTMNSIKKLTREYEKDGHLSDREWKILYKAILNIHLKMDRRLAAR